MATTYKITYAGRESIIADNCERLKVSAELSNGETRSFHFELNTPRDIILAEFEKVCELVDSEAEQNALNAERNALEDAADKTAAELLPKEEA